MSHQRIFLVEVEFCKNCSLHSSNTRHDEAKYAFYFEQVKKLVEEHSSNQILVHAMIPPEDLVPSNMLEGDNTFLNKRTGALQYFPNLGAFEVYVNQILISSKILSNKWPNIDYLVNTILEMYLKNKNDQDLSEYQVGKRVVEKPKHKHRIDPPIYRQNLEEQYRIKQYEKNLIKKQQEFYDHYIKMSKTIDYGRINHESREQRYGNGVQVQMIDAIKYQSANLNPQVKNRSVGIEKKHSFKPNSKAQKRLNAYSNSLDRKQPFFPSLQLNQAYNPTIQPIEQVLNKKRQTITQKQSRNSQRRQLVRDLRKDALEQALALEQQKVQIEEKLIKFYQKHQNLFDNLKNSRKATKVTPNLQRIGKNSKLDSSIVANQKSEKKHQPKSNKKETSSELQAIEQKYLNQVMKSEDPQNSEGRFATEEKEQSGEVRRPTKILPKSQLSDKKQKNQPRRKLVVQSKTKQVRQTKEFKQQKSAKLIKPTNKSPGPKSPPPKAKEQKDFQNWISNELKEQNQIQEKDLIRKSRQMDDSLIHHLNDLKNYEGLTSQEGLQSDSRAKKISHQKGSNNNLKGQTGKDMKKKQPIQTIEKQDKKVLETFEKTEQKIEHKVTQIPPPPIQSKAQNIKIVSTTNIKIQFQAQKPQKTQQQQQTKEMKIHQSHSIDATTKSHPKQAPPKLQNEAKLKIKTQEKQNPMELSIKITDDKKTDQKVEVFEKKGTEFVNKQEEKFQERKIENKPVEKSIQNEKPKVANIESHSQELYRKQQKELAISQLAVVMKDKINTKAQLQEPTKVKTENSQVKIEQKPLIAENKPIMTQLEQKPLETTQQKAIEKQQVSKQTIPTPQTPKQVEFHAQVQKQQSAQPPKPVLMPQQEVQQVVPKQPVTQPQLPKQVTTQAEPKPVIIQQQPSKQAQKQQQVPKEIKTQAQVPKTTTVQVQQPEAPKHVETQPQAPKQVINQPQIPKNKQTQPEVPKKVQIQPEVPKQVPIQTQVPKQLPTQAEAPKQVPVQQQVPKIQQAPKQQTFEKQSEKTEQVNQSLLKSQQPQLTQQVPKQQELIHQTNPSQTTQPPTQAPAIPQQSIQQLVQPVQKPTTQPQQPTETNKQAAPLPKVQKARYEPKYEEYKPTNEPVSMISQEEIAQMMGQNKTRKFLMDN